MSRSSPAELSLPASHAIGNLAGRAEAIQDRWRNGVEPDAEAALADDPELAAARPLALELAYEEFCLREEAGQPPDPQEFAGRFPFRTSLLRLIDLHGLFDRHSVLAPARRSDIRYQPGDRIGEFEVVRPLGSGGFADVYLARDLSAGRRGVVLKVAAGNDAEANTLGPLAHPHLMPVLSAPRVGRDRAVVMPFYGVHTLDALIAAHAGRRFRTADDVTRFLSAGYTPEDPAVLPSPAAGRPTDRYPMAAVGIIRGLATALAYLHSCGVAHRDVKPANVLLGGTGHPYLLDFNLSGDRADGRVGGTLPYLAPELLRGLTRDEPADGCDRAAADVYSFGVTAWQLLVGEHPYWADAPPSGVGRLVVADRLGDRQRAFRPTDHPRPSGVARPVWELIARCLAPDPSARPSATECVRVLSPARRRTWPRWVAVGAVAAALAAGGWAAARTRTPPAEVIPTDPYERGVYLHDRREYALAAVEFAKSAQQRQSGHHFACAAYCHARAEQDRTALLRSTEAQKYGYADPALHQLDAYCLWTLGDRERAKISLQLALAQLPNDPGVQLLRGLIELSEAQQGGRPLDRQIAADVRRAVENGGPVAAEAWLVLAKLTLAVRDCDHPDRHAAVEMVRNGVRTGLRREKVEEYHSVVTALKSLPSYKTALNTPVAPDGPDVHPYLVCPIPSSAR